MADQYEPVMENILFQVTGTINANSTSTISFDYDLNVRGGAVILTDLMISQSTVPTTAVINFIIRKIKGFFSNVTDLSLALQGQNIKLYPYSVITNDFDITVQNTGGSNLGVHFVFKGVHTTQEDVSAVIKKLESLQNV